MNGPVLGPPRDASLDGHRVDALFGLTTAVALSLLAAVVAVLAFLLWRYRARPGRAAAYDHGSDRSHVFAVLGTAAFVLVAVDATLVGRAGRDMAAHFWARPRGAGVLRVEIMPQQWAWNIRYAGPDDRFGTPDDVVTLNDLRVPVGTPVSVQLVARDVIHSFFLPNFRVKQDAVPGRVTRTWFQATSTGRYDIACAELCGFAHYQMRGALTVLPRDGWERWYANAAADARRGYVAGDAGAHWGWDWHE